MEVVSNVLVLVGPTASGKTQISLRLAEQYNAEIISADSRQIFKYMDIGTAKPSIADRNKVKHYFVDELSPEEDFNAGKFGKLGREIVNDIIKRKKVPFVVGGSGLYIRSLIDGLFDGPAANNEIREMLYHRLRTQGVEVLLEELRKVDPITASTLLRSNTRRIVRALEVYHLTGVAISKYRQQRPTINFTPCMVGLRWKRANLYDRINRRVDYMIQQGLLDEVRTLQLMGYSESLNSLQTVGYKEVFNYFRGAITYERMIEMIKQNTRRFAKRQLTWFRADKRIRWFDVESEEQLPAVAEEIANYFAKFVKE